MTPHGEKVRRGQERARARGVRFGRPTNPRLTHEVLERARAMLADGMHLRAIAADLHVPTTTLHRTLRRNAESRGPVAARRGTPCVASVGGLPATFRALRREACVLTARPLARRRRPLAPSTVLPASVAVRVPLAGAMMVHSLTPTAL